MTSVMAAQPNGAGFIGIAWGAMRVAAEAPGEANPQTGESTDWRIRGPENPRTRAPPAGCSR